MPEPASPCPAKKEARDEWDVLIRLLDEPRPWSVAELARDCDEALGTHDAIRRLHGAGLINRMPGDFVCIAHAAVRYNEIAL
jgi:predicted transcriptional regulator